MQLLPMFPIIEFSDNPTKDEFINAIAIARIFKNDIKRSTFIVFEFTDIEKQIKNWLCSFKKQEWWQVEQDMIFRAERHGYISSINGTKINNLDALSKDYFEKSKIDIVKNAIQSFDILSPIAITENSAIYSIDSINKITPVVDFEYIQSVFNKSTPKIKNLKSSYCKI